MVRFIGIGKKSSGSPKHEVLISYTLVLHFVYENEQGFVQFRKSFQRRRGNFSNETRAFAEKESRGESGTQIKTTFCALFCFFYILRTLALWDKNVGEKSGKM